MYVYLTEYSVLRTMHTIKATNKVRSVRSCQEDRQERKTIPILVHASAALAWVGRVNRGDLRTGHGAQGGGGGKL